MVFDLKMIKRAIDQVAEEKGIDAAKVLEAIESAIAAAYKKEYEKKGEIVRAKFDVKTGELKFWQVKTVVDETTVRFKEEGDEESAEGTVAAPKGGEPRPTAEFGREVATAEVNADGTPAEPVLPRFNPDRHITTEDAQKEKKG